MLNNMKYLLASTAFIALTLLHTAPSYGETVVRETVTETVTPSSTSTSTSTTVRSVTPTDAAGLVKSDGAKVVQFIDFDLNKDKLLSRSEVGEMLFKLYDTDGNEIIDNKEYERRAVITVMPMQKDTVVSYDMDGDGKAEVTEYTYERFVQDTMLTRYDANKDGLSPHEFTDLEFLSADVNRDKAIDLKEWQGSYNASIDKANKERARLNK